MENKKIHKHASIIGFAGLAGSGKDTAGLAMVKNYPNKFVHCAFVNKLKETIALPQMRLALQLPLMEGVIRSRTSISIDRTSIV